MTSNGETTTRPFSRRGGWLSKAGSVGAITPSTNLAACSRISAINSPSQFGRRPTGCRRCADVCPVGNDYEGLLKKWVDEISEVTPEKLKRLEEMVAEATLPEAYEKQSHWIGKVGMGAPK